MHREKIAAPQYLRGLAALAVMLAHWSGVGSYPKEEAQRLFLNIPLQATHPNFINTVLEWWNRAVQHIWPLSFSFATGGVLIFFLISGFVIPISVEKYSAGEFAVRRVCRLLLPVWAVLALWFGLHALTELTPLGNPQPYDLRAFVLNGLLINDWFWSPNIEPGLWTLLIEVKFYALLAMLAILVGRLTLLNVLSLGAFLSLFVLPFFGNETYDALLKISQDSGLVWSYRFFRVMNDCIPFIIFMLIGTLAYLWYFNRCKTSQCLVAAAGLFALYATTSVIKPNGADQLHGVTDGLKVLIVFFVVLWLNKRGMRNTRFRGVSWLLNELGNISYPLYLVHGMIGMTLAHILWIKTGSANAATAIGGVIVIALSWLTHRTAETWGQNIGASLGRKFFSRRGVTGSIADESAGIELPVIDPVAATTSVVARSM